MADCSEEKWILSDRVKEEENGGLEGEGEEEEGEEALSLCDLPIYEEDQSGKEEARVIETQEDFNFRSWGGAISSEPVMCAADEVFFKGQIMPWRHSVSASSDSGLTQLRRDCWVKSRSLSRSESMDHFHSGGFTGHSSRSSSIRSHNSASSGSSTTATAPGINPNKFRNQFHSHPSPTPQIRIQNFRPGNMRNPTQKSTVWSIFRVGLVKGPEIELQNLKARGINNYYSNNSGSRNSSCSINSTVSDKTKKKNRFLGKNGGLFSDCKCSVNAVENVRPATVIIRKSGGGMNLMNEASEETRKEEEEKKKKKRKQAMSRHRTFEWLKQLSLEGVADE